jgi:hypothetical protein
MQLCLEIFGVSINGDNNLCKNLHVIAFIPKQRLHKMLWKWNQPSVFWALQDSAGKGKTVQDSEIQCRIVKYSAG